jgi:hypothetical protein
MQRLVAEGLLRSERSWRIFVIELTNADVYDVYLVRKAIERASIEEIRRGDAALARARLGKPVKAMVAAVDAPRYRDSGLKSADRRRCYSPIGCCCGALCSAAPLGCGDECDSSAEMALTALSTFDRN